MDKKLLNDIGATIAQLRLQLQVMRFSVSQVYATNLLLSRQTQLGSSCYVCYIGNACQLIYVMLSILCRR